MCHELEDTCTQKRRLEDGREGGQGPTRTVEPRSGVEWKPVGRKKRGRPRRTWKDGVYTTMSERGLRMGNVIWKLEYIYIYNITPCVEPTAPILDVKIIPL
jgi:hypothetical protein